MNVRVLLAASAVGLCASVAVLAEPPIGSRLGDRVVRGREEDEVTAARHGQEFASCLVNRRAEEVQRLLSQTNKAGYKASYKKLAEGRLDCFNMGDDANDVTEGWRLSIPPDIMRGMLSEELIKRNMRDYAALPVLARQMAYTRPWYGATSRDASVDEMATCVSETDAADTLSLLKTRPYSQEEGAAFAAIVPHLGSCLRVGVKLTGNRQSLRAALADALYQRVASPATTGSPAAPQQAKAQ